MDYVPLGITTIKSRRRNRFAKRWIVYGLMLGMLALPGLGIAAYQPGFLVPGNNLSDLASAATAWINLGGGTAGKKAASDNTKANVASVNGPTVVGHLATYVDVNGTIQDGGLANPATTVTNYTSNTATVTLSNTNNLTQVVAQAIPAPLTVNLNATSLAAGFTQCVKDKSNNFATNNATVKTTDASTIDGVAGATGYVMNQNKQANCFVFDGSANWVIM